MKIAAALLATITLVNAQVPANDNVADAVPLTTFPATLPGTNVNATTETGEPNHANGDFGNLATNSVWYQWEPATDSAISILVENVDFDHILAAYLVTDSVDFANLTEIATSDAFVSGRERVTFRGLGGSTYLIALDGATTATSGTFELQVATVPAPANDNFTAAEVMPAAFPTSVTGTTIAATSETGEPDHATVNFNNLASDSVWYTWTSTTAGPVAVSCFGTDLDGALAVYTPGTGISDLVLIAEADDQGPGVRESVLFAAESDTDYIIAVDSYSAAEMPSRDSGDFELRIDGLPANDNFTNALELGAVELVNMTGSTVGATAEEGETDHGMDINGNVVSSSIWYRWEAPATGNFIVQVAGSDFDAVLAAYTDTLTPISASDVNRIGNSANGISEQLAIAATSGTSYFFAVDGAGSTGLFDFQIFPTFALNDDFANAIDLTPFALPFQAPGTTVGATPEESEPNHTALLGFGAVAANSVWYQWTAPADAIASINIFGAPGLEVTFSVYTGDAIDNLTPIAEVDARFGQSEDIAFTATAGVTYFIAVQGFSNDSGGATQSEGTFTLALSVTSNTLTNDNFASATDLNELGLPLLIPGTTNNATPESNEPNHTSALGFGAVVANSVWYRWTATEDASISVSVEAELSMDTVLSVYDGTELTSLALVSDADSSSGANESSSFTVIAGETYYIAIQGFSTNGTTQSSGAFLLRIVPTAITLTPYERWIARYPNVTDSDPNANPSGDTISNLLKLVFDLDPTLHIRRDPNAANYPIIKRFSDGDLGLEGRVVSDHLGTGSGSIKFFIDRSDDLRSFPVPGSGFSDSGFFFSLLGDDISNPNPERFARLRAVITP